MELAQLADAVENGRVVWKKHVLQRMLERGISRASVKQAIVQGETIEDYLTPSCLIYLCGQTALHVVAAYANEQVFIITAYYPDPLHFEADGRKRKTS